MLQQYKWLPFTLFMLSLGLGLIHGATADFVEEAEVDFDEDYDGLRGVLLEFCEITGTTSASWAYSNTWLPVPVLLGQAVALVGVVPMFYVGARSLGKVL